MMMTCRDFVEFIMAYLDGELDEAPRTTFEEHLSMCPHCKDYLATYEQTIRMGRKACAEPDDPVPEQVPDELVKAVLEARKRQS